MNYQVTAQSIIKAIGGESNVLQLTHCMTRLRFNLKDETIVDDAKVKNISGVLGVTAKGGQYQVIIGPKVSGLYEEIISQIKLPTGVDTKIPQTKKTNSLKSTINNIFNFLAGSMTPLIPILLAASLMQTIAVMIGPQLLGWVNESNDMFRLFMFTGQAGFYFLPVFIGYSAAKKLDVSIPIGMLLGGILLSPVWFDIVESGEAFSVYRLPAFLQNYNGSVLPMVLTIYVMSHVERFLKKYSPDLLKVFLVPFGTLIIMLPLMFVVLGPLGQYIGIYISEFIISINGIAAPIGVALIAVAFRFMVLTGMHPIMFAYLFTTFPTMGYDDFLIPGILVTSWSAVGIAISVIRKLKKREDKQLAMGYLVTWFFGSVGEPMLYGLFVKYKTPLIAGIISSAITGLLAGALGLRAYVMSTINGVYALFSFVGGDTQNYIALVITIIVAVVSGYITMSFFELGGEEHELE